VKKDKWVVSHNGSPYRADWEEGEAAGKKINGNGGCGSSGSPQRSGEETTATGGTEGRQKKTGG